MNNPKTKEYFMIGHLLNNCCYEYSLKGLRAQISIYLTKPPGKVLNTSSKCCLRTLKNTFPGNSAYVGISVLSTV